MTATIERTSFLGMPMRKARDILHSWRYAEKDVARIARRSEVREDPRNVIALLSQLKANDLIGLEETNLGGRKLGLTQKGLGLAHATAMKRTLKAKAQAKLDTLVANAVRANENAKLPRHVDRIWVFGSMIDDAKADVGDIDFVVESSLTKEYVGKPFNEVLNRVVDEFEDILPANISSPDYYDADMMVLNRYLYGPRRDGLFAPNNIATLIDLHQPCRLVFDKARGGPVNDEVLPHHPESTERANHIKERLVAPELRLCDSLSDATFLSSGATPVQSWFTTRVLGSELGSDDTQGEGVESSNGFVLTSPSEARKRFPGLVHHLTPKDIGEIDGVKRFVIGFRRWWEDGGSEDAPAVAVVERTPYWEDGVCGVRCNVSLLGPEEDRFTRDEVEWVRNAVILILGADARIFDEINARDDKLLSIEMDVTVEGNDERAMDWLTERLEVMPDGSFHGHMNGFGSSVP